MRAHCNETISELKEQCSNLIQERDAAIAEPAKAKQEVGGWKALKKEVAKEIEKRYVFTSLANHIREEGMDTISFDTEELEVIDNDLITVVHDCNAQLDTPLYKQLVIDYLLQKKKTSAEETAEQEDDEDEGDEDQDDNGDSEF